MKMLMLFYFLLGAVTSGLLQKSSGLIPMRYQLFFSLLTGLLFCYSGWHMPWGVQLILVWIFLLGLMAETCVDLRHKIILDDILLLLLIAGLVYGGAGGVVWRNSLWGALAGSGLLGLIFILSNGGMGFGDVKFAGVLGVWTGFPGIFVALYLAFLIGGAAALFLCITHKANMSSRIPFGPCLSAGAVLSFFCSARILDWYWSLFI